MKIDILAFGWAIAAIMSFIAIWNNYTHLLWSLPLGYTIGGIIWYLLRSGIAEWRDLKKSKL